MKFLQTAAMTHDDVSITDMLFDRLEIVEPSRPIGNIHASSLTKQSGFCPREVVLCKALGRKPYPNKVSPPMQVTYHEGKDAQARFNNDWLLDKMVGNWECEQCGHLHEFQKYPVKCAKCLTKGARYHEVVFYHPSGAQGSLDAIVDVGKPKLRLVEFKIMSHDEWITLKAPLAEHRARSKLYLELVAGSSHPNKHHIDTDRMHVIYKIRGYGKMDAKKRISPFKEFIVHKDPDEIAVYIHMAMAVQHSKDNEWGSFPEGVCATITDKRVHKCCVGKECFSGKYPPTIFWKAGST